MHIYMLMDAYFPIGNCIIVHIRRMHLVFLQVLTLSLFLFSCWAACSVGEDRVLKQVIFFSCSSSRLITSGAVAASVACSTLGVVVGRSCCPEELLPCSCPTCPITAFQGAFLLSYPGIPGGLSSGVCCCCCSQRCCCSSCWI